MVRQSVDVGPVTSALRPGLVKRMCPLPNVSTDQPCAVASLASWRISLLARLVSPGCFFLIAMDPPFVATRCHSIVAGARRNLTADAPSLALLRFVSRELEGGGLLVVGIYRHTEVDRGHPRLGTLADLTRGQQRRRLLLGGLDQREVASFVALVAGVQATLVVGRHGQPRGGA